MGTAITGALCGPVLGALASYTGTGPAFAGVAAIAVALAVAAWRSPAARPEGAQPIAMLFRALRARRIQVAMWMCALPALLFGNLSVLAPLRLSHLGWSAAAIGATYLVMSGIEAAWAPFLGRASDHFGREPPMCCCDSLDGTITRQPIVMVAHRRRTGRCRQTRRRRKKTGSSDSPCSPPIASGRLELE